MKRFLLVLALFSMGLFASASVAEAGGFRGFFGVGNVRVTVGNGGFNSLAAVRNRNRVRQLQLAQLRAIQLQQLQLQQLQAARHFGGFNQFNGLGAVRGCR